MPKRKIPPKFPNFGKTFLYLPPLGTAGLLAAFSGTALVVGSFWATAFFAPALAASDPAGFDASEAARGGAPPGRLAVAYLVSWATFVLGWMLFGVAAWRVGIYPRVAALLLVLGSPLALGTLLVVGFPTGIFFSAAVAWMGYALWTEKSIPAQQPVRVT